jgi:hypothetical protein
LLIYNISKKLMADDMPVPSIGPRGVHPLQTIGRRRAAELAGAAGAWRACGCALSDNHGMKTPRTASR